MAVVGIDACKHGWVGVVVDRGAVVRAVCERTIDATVAAALEELRRAKRKSISAIVSELLSHPKARESLRRNTEYNRAVRARYSES